MRPVRLKSLAACRRGQTTMEFMLVLGVLSAALILAFYLIAPMFVDGFVELVRRIMECDP